MAAFLFASQTYFLPRRRKQAKSALKGENRAAFTHEGCVCSALRFLPPKNPRFTGAPAEGLRRIRRRGRDSQGLNLDLCCRLAYFSLKFPLPRKIAPYPAARQRVRRDTDAPPDNRCRDRRPRRSVCSVVVGRFRTVRRPVPTPNVRHNR